MDATESGSSTRVKIRWTNRRRDMEGRKRPSEGDTKNRNYIRVFILWPKRKESLSIVRTINEVEQRLQSFACEVFLSGAALNLSKGATLGLHVFI